MNKSSIFQRLAVFLAVALLSMSTIAKTVAIIQPQQLAEYIQQHSQVKPLVVTFSSTDTSCGFCSRYNQLLQRAQQKLSQDYHFVRIDFNPWRSIARYKTLQAHYEDIGFPLKGIPTSIIYYKGDARLYNQGFNENLISDLQKNIELAKVSKARTTDKSMYVEIHTIKPDQLDGFVSKNSTQKPLLLHLSSTDKNCSYCIKSNDKLAIAAQQYGDKYEFADIDFNPWQSLNQEIALLDKFEKLGKRITGLPTIAIYFNNEVQIFQKGEQGNLVQFLGNFYDKAQGKTISPSLVKEVENIDLRTIEGESLDNYVLSNSSDRPLIVHISSQDKNCIHCIDSNTYIRKAYRDNKDKYQFIELTYTPWRSVIKDGALKAHFSKYNLPIKGLPITVIYYKNNIAGMVPGKDKNLSEHLTKGYAQLKDQIYRKRQ